MTDLDRGRMSKKMTEVTEWISVEFDGLTVGSRTMVCFTWHVSRHVVCSLLCESKHALSWAMDIRRIHSHRKLSSALLIASSFLSPISRERWR